MQTYLHKTREKARASWNRRAGESWSNKPPSEDGCYLVVRNNVHIEAFGKPELIQLCFNRNVAFTAYGTFVIEDFHKEYPAAIWYKPFIPALPEKGGAE
jgi:hypothetical protein